jgi:hypothetical protein
MRLATVGAAAGTIVGIVEVRNKSTHDCDLYGYAGLQLLDSHEHPLPTKVIWSATSFFSTSTAVKAVVGLPAGTPPISPDRPVSGHAYIPITWNDVQEPCSDAARLKVTPPDAFTSLVISATTTLFGSGGILVCSGGTLTVNPTRAAMAPPS